MATRAAIKVILRKDLENIEIPILSISKQQELIALYQNVRQQEKLLIKKSKLQREIIDITIKNLVRI